MVPIACSVGTESLLTPNERTRIRTRRWYSPRCRSSWTASQTSRKACLGSHFGTEEVLEGEGYEVVEAEDGAVALERFEAEGPAIALLDIMMPQMNGYDVCKAILKRRPEVPVIFISAKSEEIDKVIGLELGADDFISKPFGVREARGYFLSVK